MPYEQPEAGDPHAIHGVGVPDPTGDSLRQMAECFAEEFLRLGHEPGYVLSLFESPRYALPHRAFRAFGAEETRAIVERAAKTWSRPRHTPAS